MAKRRTRKEKLNAQHGFEINWDELNLDSPNKTRLAEANVNRQKKSRSRQNSLSEKIHKRADYMEKGSILRSIKIDLIKSLIISSLVIAIELVLYLTWV